MHPAALAASGQPLPVSTFAEWREAARELLAHGVAPAEVCWGEAGVTARAPGAAAGAHNRPLQQPQPAPLLPRSLMDLLQSAACCRVPDRWAFLYRVVWRWQHGERTVQGAHDPDGARLHAMARTVRREEHDMQANIRFRERPAEAGPPRFVAWCEPRHDILPQLAAHFASRLGKVSWIIASPGASVLWDGATLHNCGPLLDAGGAAPWLAWFGAGAPWRAAATLLQLAPQRWPAAPCAPWPALAAPRATGAAAGAQPPPADRAGEQAGDGAQPATLAECRRCGLWQHATQPVGGAGPKRAQIMLVGEQPGDQEDLAGQPFVGPAGKLLDRACDQAGLDRRRLYVTNAVKHFKWEPRGKRRMHKTPAQREVEACAYWLDKELASVKPAVVVAMGSTALKSVLGDGHAALKDALGRPLRHQGRWVVATYHPSYALRVPGEAARHAAFAAIVDGLKVAQALLERPPEQP